MNASLDTSVRFLRGVGPRRAEALERLGIRTLEDLLLHLPRRYVDRSQLVRIRELVPGAPGCVRARVETLQGRPGWRGRRTLQAVVADDTGRMRVVWFNAWPSDALAPGNEVVLVGPVVEANRGLEMRQPEFERVDAESQSWLHAGRIVPLYPATHGVTQKYLRQAVDAALAQIGTAVPEFLPDAVRGDRPHRAQALRDVHFPATMDAAEPARQRLAFEELFCLETMLMRRRAEGRARTDGIRFTSANDLHARYFASLPFTLTAAQDRVWSEVERDLRSGQWMQRLVLGDVGAGKTAIAVAAMLLAVESGWQTALLAPTEPLALQHAQRLGTVCDALGVRAARLVGSLPNTEKEAIRDRIAAGAVDLVIGTHALLQPDVRFARLGLAVVDEQQRFGVLQRAALYAGAQRPHVLVLSATPIPRSLAQTLYGDLDVSRLDEKPPGRRAVKTHVVPTERRDAMWGFVRAELEAGRSGYVVLPLIDESDALELRAARGEYEVLRKGPLAGLPIALLHGRLPAAERDATLARFHAGEIRLLVCTSVVEVGLDVAAASVVVVHHPERFGLAQLHQLRGRVGRGDAPSYCFLLPGERIGRAAQERLQRFAELDDGFRIAELDLELRGPGDLDGTRQHGFPELQVADLGRDLALVPIARDFATRVLADDPRLDKPEHAALRTYLETRFAGRDALAQIG